MKNYIDLINFVLINGTKRIEPRTNSSILSCFNAPTFVHNNEDGYPLLTSKKMAYRSIWAELEWFIKGRTDLLFLLDKGCNVWNSDAFRCYKDNYAAYLGIPVEELTIETFIYGVKNDKEFFYDGCNLGPIYGKQWRNFNGVDQLENLVTQLKTNPYGRRHILNSWNVPDLNIMTLPPCHLMFQCYVREKGGIQYLDLKWYQRSADIFLGIPYNIASYSLLQTLIAKECGFSVGFLYGVFGDLHLYEEHISVAKEQIEKDLFDLPKIDISDTDLFNFDSEKVKLINYKSNEILKAKLIVG